MSSKFQVDTDRIQAASGDIGRISADIETQVRAMLARLTALQDAWTGEASGRFQGVVAEWRGTQATVRESLDHIGTALHQAGRQYAQAEVHNTAMFR